MATINDVYKGLLKIGQNIAKMGGQIQSENKSYSLQELADGVLTVPTYSIAGGSQAIQTWEMPGTTISVFDTSDNLIGSGTTDATDGGMINVDISTPGIYRVTAEKNSAQIWTKQVSVNGGQVTICKTPLTLDDYTEDEIEASCVNHYAHHMFSVGDYRTEASFMGSTTLTYRRKYILEFNKKPLVSGGYAEITWGFLYGTPSSYNMHGTNINNVSWEGCDMRQRCLPSGSIYYVYDSTVTSSTSGTFYTYDFNIDDWVEKTLPADYVSGVDYYVLNTTSSDGVFYSNALPLDVRAHAKAVKNKTWIGYTNMENATHTSATTRQTSTNLIESEDIFFLPSCYELFGSRPNISTTAQYWNYNQNEGDKVDLPINDIWTKFMCSTLWFRSPHCNSSSSFCSWYTNSGTVASNSASNSSYALLCYCQ